MYLYWDSLVSFFVSLPLEQIVRQIIWNNSFKYANTLSCQACHVWSHEGIREYLWLGQW